jgi:hypothetical protein
MDVKVEREDLSVQMEVFIQVKYLMIYHMALDN